MRVIVTSQAAGVGGPAVRNGLRAVRRYDIDIKVDHALARDAC